MAVTEEDVNMVTYFILERGDITRWSSWEKRKAEIAEEYPELIAALYTVDIAERTLKAVVNNMMPTKTEDEGGSEK